MRRLEGLYVQFSRQLDPAANARIHALSDRLLAHPISGVTDLYPGYVNLYVEFDATATDRSSVRAWVRKHLEGLTPKSEGRKVTLGVRYDGPDLYAVADRLGMTAEEVVRRHCGVRYRVYTVGFVPGQPMLGSLDPALYLPRRPTPRARVEAHSLGIAVSQTCIYPLPTPGGWHLLGTVLVPMYDPHRDPVFWLEAGDTVRFEPRQGPTPPDLKTLETLPAEPKHPVLRVEQPGLMDVPVDGGRFLAARFGMARSGAMDERSARLANARVGNSSEAVLLEMTLKGSAFTVLNDVVLALAGFGMQGLLDGEPLPVGESFLARKGQRLLFKTGPFGVRMYLAAAGGLEVSPFMGSRSPDLKGGIGRRLEAGDLLGIAEPRVARVGFGSRPPDMPRVVTLRLLAGPQATPEALEALARSSFAVSSADRMGVRLTGAKVLGGELVSEATPMGAVQITTEGDPILLLNDRGRIGGYAKPAVVDPRDLPLAAQLRPGQQVRFRLVGGSDCGHWFMEA
ncbi:MAG: urea amidolyase family protein [Meiothermus sp.]|nr:urea amidolyase family protein [Meiothermus sp.]